ncbi:acyltransferase family protein [Herbaspirillum camelliae]|uniref:acyltransferase family protein n=1 Tax=Herbaspirillum camelliae TaxID=1892903 RepID=UPI000949D63F|nr:acyltransferase family protein [Herbaspirillum camelliae]
MSILQRPALSHSKYRSDIDGLRAIAVLAVVSFHGFPNFIRGGFIGVDVFFVISGYLISTIIFENLDRGTFTFTEFYARRVRRIFPALLLVLSTCFVVGWFVLLTDEYKQLGKHIAGGASFVSNFLLRDESGYFDNSAETKPLLHLWSLGIEEQFYILWPMLLFFSWRRKLNLLTITIIVALASFTANIKGINKDASAAFYLPQSRFWELLSGTLLAWFTLYKQHTTIELRSRLGTWILQFIYSEKRKSDGKFLIDVSSITGLCIVLYGFWRINKELAFPGMWALVPILGTILIIAAGPAAWVNRTLLSNKILVWFGLISFPLYLWHWPVLSFARIVDNELPSYSLRVGAIALAIILAWFTYEIVERPIRTGNNTNTKITVTALIGLMALVGAVGYWTFAANGWESRVSADITRISRAAGEWQYPGKLTAFNFENRTFYRQNSNVDEITLFIGDSNIEQYYVRTDELISTKPNNSNSVVFATGGGCLAIPGSPYDEVHMSCTNLMETALNYAKTNASVASVVIGAQWNSYLSDGYGLRGSFGTAGKDYSAALNRLARYIRELKYLGKKVYLILNIPIGDELDPKFMITRDLKYFPHAIKLKEGGLSRKDIDERYGKIQKDLEQIARSAGADVVNPMDFLCNATKCSSLDDEGEPIYKDRSHLRPQYVRYRASFIDEFLTWH